MSRYATPNTNAYFDGTRYHCYNIDCFAENATLNEINRLNQAVTYIPILKCSICGTTYFGLITRDVEAEQEITEYAEKQRTAEEERAQMAEQDNEENIAITEQVDAEQERILHEEVEMHEAVMNGDIILPNILTL